MRSQRPDDHSKKYPVPTSSHCTKRTHGSHTRVHVEDLLNHTSSRCLHHALAVRRTSMPLEKGWFDREEVKKKNISCLFLMCFLFKDIMVLGWVYEILRDCVAQVLVNMRKMQAILLSQNLQRVESEGWCEVFFIRSTVGVIWVKSCRHFLSITLSETNNEFTPGNRWFEYLFPFGMVNFQELC